MLIASLATSAWANCLADSAMTPKAQMACCKAGHDKCPMAGTPEDCCKGEAQREQQTSVATHEVAPPPSHAPVLLATVIPTVPDFAIIRALIFASPQGVLKRPSAPPYLLASALLI